MHAQIYSGSSLIFAILLSFRAAGAKVYLCNDVFGCQRDTKYFCIGARTSLPEELLYKALANRRQVRPGPTVSPGPARLLALYSCRLIGIVHAAFLSCSRVRKTSVATPDDHRTFRRLPQQRRVHAPLLRPTLDYM